MQSLRIFHGILVTEQRNYRNTENSVSEKQCFVIIIFDIQHKPLMYLAVNPLLKPRGFFCST